MTEKKYTNKKRWPKLKYFFGENDKVLKKTGTVFMVVMTFFSIRRIKDLGVKIVVQ